MKPVVVLGVDPGMTSGYARIRMRDSRNAELLEKGDLTDYMSVKLLAKMSCDAVAVEDFYYRPGVVLQDRKLVTVRAIGGLEVLIPAGKLYLQQPAAKERCPNKVLKELGLYKNSDSPHVRDALRHAVILGRRLLREGSTSSKKRKRTHRH
jgi:hypothetical protein